MDLSDEEYARLARELTAAELRDYIGVVVLGYGVREWAREINRAHQNITPRLRSVRGKLESVPNDDETQI